MTKSDLLAACHEYQDAACRAFAVCVDLSEPEVAQCMENGRSRCERELTQVPCWERQRDAFEDCAVDVAEESCDSLCDTETCEDTCMWSCPQISAQILLDVSG